MKEGKNDTTTANEISYIFRSLFSVGTALPPQLTDTNTGQLPSNCVADHGAKNNPAFNGRVPLRVH